MIKAVFFDIDNTLVSHFTHSVPHSTKIAIKKLQEKGIYTFIATGRHTLELKELPLEDLTFDAYITLNGQYCYNNKEIIYDLPINKEDIHKLITLTNNNPFPLMFVEEDQMYINYIDESVKQAQLAISSSLPPTKTLKQNKPIYQMIAYNITNDLLTKIKALTPHCIQTYWHQDAIDILPATGGKHNGIKQILSYYNIKADECIAFGDGHNDITMFNMIPLSIAMGNANKDVKKAAYDTTDHIDQDGIYNALKKYKII